MYPHWSLESCRVTPSEIMYPNESSGFSTKVRCISKIPPVPTEVSGSFTIDFSEARNSPCVFWEAVYGTSSLTKLSSSQYLCLRTGLLQEESLDFKREEKTSWSKIFVAVQPNMCVHESLLYKYKTITMKVRKNFIHVHYTTEQMHVFVSPPPSFSAAYKNRWPQ